MQRRRWGRASKTKSSKSPSGSRIEVQKRARIKPRTSKQMRDDSAERPREGPGAEGEPVTRGPLRSGKMSSLVLVLSVALQLIAARPGSAQTQAKFYQAAPTLQANPSTEVQLVRGLANSDRPARLELPCLVDQANCGEVYYITWTRQASANASAAAKGFGQGAGASAAGAPGPAWTRVYLYTGANDSAPHKPIGDLVSRATFVMPEPARQPPLARLVIEEPRLSDEALYKCDVTYVKGKCPSISLARVQMMALPERAQLFQVQGGLDAPRRSTPLASGQLIGPLNEHEQLRLVCVVAGGRPAPRAVFWRKIDLTGRTINLAAASPATAADQPGRALEVALNHTLTSGDLGAKFECRVEHEALESLRPTARIISATTSQRLPGGAPTDALLDLHPAQSSPINRRDGGVSEGDRDTEESAPALSQTAAASEPSLDAHVIIDLNVGVQSLDLFLGKLGPNQPAQAVLSSGAAASASAAGKRVGGESSGPLREGDIIELECIAYNSKPAANITWLNGADAIGGGVTAASMSELEAASTRRSVVERGNPPWAAQAGVSTAARGQRNRRLLQRNHVQLNANGHTYNTHSYLSIKLSRHEHGALITCQARNGPMREALTKSVELQVQHAPIVLMEPAAGVTVTEWESPAQVQRANSVISSNSLTGSGASSAGQSPEQVQIYCIYSANPPQLLAGSTRWFKDGQPLTISGDRLAESATQNGYPTLTIKQVSRHDAGKYDCQLTNGAGTSERLAASEAARLEVHFRPSVQLRLYKAGADQEVDIEQTLVMAGDELELACEVLEALPNKIDKFHWFSASRAPSGAAPTLRPLADTDGQRLKLGPLPANFTLTSYACTAINSIGQSDFSNTVELELSHTPGLSFIKPVSSARVRKLVLSAGKHAPFAQTGQTSGPGQSAEPGDESSSPPLPGRPLAAGRELMLECATQELGRPRANLWLWFKNGQTIGDTQAQETAADLRDNPISDRLQQDSSPAAGADQQRPVARLLASGRYLFIPAVQLNHKGNYSCVAVNRLGSGGAGSSSSAAAAAAAGGRDSYQLRVALAPSFVQPLPGKTFWPETQTTAGGGLIAAAADEPAQQKPRQLELVCHVQCEPICQIEWLRNNEPLDIKSAGHNQAGAGNHFAYHVSQTIMDENEPANLFRSVESRLALAFEEPPSRPDKRAPAIDRDRLLARRHFLNSSNFTCQSGPNAMGPPVRSTTRLVVQYPPENVLISAPSDKLSLVEGSNGPLLACEAAGEPQVQYRWLLLRGVGNNIITSSDLVAARYNVKHFANSTSQQETAARRAAAPGARSNDVAGAGSIAGAGPEADERLVELTGPSAGEQVGGTSVFTLDLSSISIDRKQAGHYICEASNALGQTRQSVYVNVLYKPTCATLHMHSLDSTALAAARELEGAAVVVASRPAGAGKRDEYAIVRESSEDFIGLRRILVMSPLFGGGGGGGEAVGAPDKLSLRGGVFGSALEAQSAASRRPPSAADQSAALEHGADSARDETDAAPSRSIGPLASANLVAADLAPATGQRGADSWTKFNEVLLKFLNDYSRQIEQDEERRARVRAALGRSMTSERRNQQTRRSSSRASIDDAEPDANELAQDEPAAPSSKRAEDQPPRSRSAAKRTSLLTFACMAQEGNPMANLTFDWYFGAVRLPTASDNIDNALTDQFAASANQRPTLIYANENETLAISLARRLDSGAALSPFQMSFVTVSVVVAENGDGDDAPQSRPAPISAGDNNATRASRNRYQSFYGGNGLDGSRRRANNNIQFGQEFETPLGGQRPGQQVQPDIEINEQNWPERLSQLLSCSAANSVGTSEACHVRVNQDRLRAGPKGLAGSSSLYEFAKWRMPSLAQKSLLIISVLLGCSLIVFATFVLLFGPHLRAMQLLQKRPDSGASSASRDEQGTMRTGQSTSSQKSSVMGLLGNGADSSFPSSSDDDTSGRLNQLECSISNGQLARSGGHMLEMDSAELSPDDRLVGARGGQFDYDLPRSAAASLGLQRSRLVYQPDAGTFNQPAESAAHENYHYHSQQQASYAAPVGHQRLAVKQINSTSGRILASLKSKFKNQDRISDLAASRWSAAALHLRDVSNSETATTGVSADESSLANNGRTTSSLAASNRSMLHNLGVPINLRHSYAGARAQTAQRQSAYQPMTLAKPASAYYAAARDQSGLDDATYNRLLQLNSQVFIKQARLLNDSQQEAPPNAMDEFMRRRGLDTTPTFDQALRGDHQMAAGAQTNRGQPSNIYTLRNDLSQMAKSSGAKIKPPVYPRALTSQPYLSSAPHYESQAGYQISTMFKQAGVPPPPPPPPTVAARMSQRDQPALNRQTISSMMQQQSPFPITGPGPYGDSNLVQGQQYAPFRFDTIDTHLNRLADNVALGYYPAQDQQMAYANALELGHHYAPDGQYDDSQLESSANKQSSEHIYDLNAYATPEQTPARSATSGQNQSSSNDSERLRVSQLIQTFNTKLPDHPAD